MTRKSPADRAREFELFVAACTGDLLRTGYLVLFDLGAAEDVVQECLVKVARRWPRVAAMDHPVAYARRIVIRDAVREAERRRRQRQELYADPGAVVVTGDPTADRELRVVDARVDLIPLLRGLPPRQRAVLTLRYFDDLTEPQTAEVLGCSVGTVKSTISRALDRLREQLSPDTDRSTGNAEGAVSRDLA